MRKKIDLLILAIVLTVGTVGVVNAKKIGDIWHAWFYSPPSEITSLVEDSGMNDTGKKLFYRFSPELRKQSDVDSVCSAKKLGCTVGNKIYILESQSDREHYRSIVTASHEMLHVAFSRLSESEQESLETLLKTELQRPQAIKVAEQLKQYPKSDYVNEAHSFVATEIDDLSDELETYYARYFSERSKTVEAFKKSQQ